MYILTKQGSLESGAFASVDSDGETIIQFFVNEDDAICFQRSVGSTRTGP